jgi:2-oxo-3-hexenedioate decarboxylase
MKEVADGVIDSLVERIDAAQRERQEIGPLTDEVPDLTEDDAYRIQRLLIARFEARGDPVVAMKAGLTSRAKQVAMGVAEPIYGYICESMVLDEGETLDVSRLIHPRAEPEIAFLLERDLSGPGVTEADVLRATASVAPAIEIIDSRYRDFRFTLADVIADNASSARVVLGQWRPLDEALDLRLAGMVLMKNDEVIDTGAGAAVLGHPARAVAWLANALASRGERLVAGSFVMPGALSNAYPVAPGDRVQVEIDRLGSLSLRCE